MAASQELDNCDEGGFVCAGCELPLFTSAMKRASVEGNPSLLFAECMDDEQVYAFPEDEVAFKVAIHCKGCREKVGMFLGAEADCPYAVNSAAVRFVGP